MFLLIGYKRSTNGYYGDEYESSEFFHKRYNTIREVAKGMADRKFPKGAEVYDWEFYLYKENLSEVDICNESFEVLLEEQKAKNKKIEDERLAEHKESHARFLENEQKNQLSFLLDKYGIPEDYIKKDVETSDNYEVLEIFPITRYVNENS